LGLLSLALEVTPSSALALHRAFRPRQQLVQFSAIEELAIQHDGVHATLDAV